METIPTVRMSDFEKEGYVSRRQPCVISDGLAACERLRRWTPEYLATMCGDVPVDVEVSFQRQWREVASGDQRKPGYRFANIPLREAVRWITTADRTDREFYVPQEPIEKFPRLREDITFGRGLTDARAHLWFGTGNTVARLHADPSPNMFAQVFGAKRFMLFPPDQVKQLYPREGTRYPISSVDPMRPDLAAYPRFAEATPVVGTVSAGELLFLPSFWWHHVTSLSTSISVSQWWRADLFESCNRTGAKLLIDDYKRDGWTELLRSRKMPLDDLLAFAEKAAAMDQAVAALALSVVLDYFDRWPDHHEPKATVELEVRQGVERLRQAVLQDEVYDIGRDTIAALAKRVRHESVLGAFARASRPQYARSA